MSDADKIKRILANELGVPEKGLPTPVVVKAVVDPLYLHHLINCKSDEFLLIILFNEAISPSSKGNAICVENSKLFKNAITATIKWLASGARFVNDVEYKRRINTCMGCPYVSQAPSTSLYRLLKSQMVCSLCGCDIERKAKLMTEECPDKQYGEKGRWS